MSTVPQRTRAAADRNDPDEWLIEAAVSAGHDVQRRERTPGTTAWRVLLNAGIPDAEVLRLACAASGAEAADFSRLSPAMGSLLSQGTALKFRVVPLGVDKGALGVATSNPKDTSLERDLAFAAKQRVRLFAGSPSDIIRAQAIVFGAAYGTRVDTGVTFAAPASPSATRQRAEPVGRLSMSGAMPAVSASAASTTPSAAVASAFSPDVVDKLLAAAFADRAAQVILDPAPDGGLVVRFRVDGTAHDRFRIAEAHAAPMIQTLKRRAQLDVAATRHSQHGSTTVEAPDGPVSVRVSIEPLANGRERAMLRLFSSQALLPLGELGLTSSELHQINQLLKRPTGLLIVAGPANAGKTTTLYALAGELRQRGRTVSTIEEPIDYPLEQIRQVQLSKSPHLTLSSALNAVGGKDGDVIVIGATLDAPALEQCVSRHAPTRLVIASLDNSDRLSTLARLREMHPDGTSLADELVGVVVTRVLRRLCTTCALPQVEAELPELQQNLLFGLPTAKVRRPVGCASCRTTGYRGRIAIVEILPVTPALKGAISRGATSAELAQISQESGMPSLWDSGMHHVLEGVTSLAELLDSVPPPETSDAGPQGDIDALLAQLLGAPKMKTTSELVLPATLVVPAGAPLPAHPPALPPAASPQTPVTPATSLRVLLVDDDAEARRVLARELTQAGIIVLQAADGVSALALAQRVRPDVVVTDVALPRLDAIELLKGLGTQTTRAVVVRTAQTDEALHLWLREAGAHAIVDHELPAAKLIERLHELTKSAPRR